VKLILRDGHARVLNAANKSLKESRLVQGIGDEITLL
jgi:hypothetical protein